MAEVWGWQGAQPLRQSKFFGRGNPPVVALLC